MLPVTADTIRLTLHVLAATVWVGGQVTVAGLLPGLGTLGHDAPGTMVRRVNRIIWPAFSVLVATGVWHLAILPVGDYSPEWQITLLVKITVAAVAGVSAGACAGVRSRAVLAALGALSVVTSILAVLLGVMLRG